MIYIAYPIPLDAWNVFSPFVERFTNTFRDNHTGFQDYKVLACVCGGELIDPIRRMFFGINTGFIHYPDNGCDIGSAQYAAKTVLGYQARADDFIICMTSRCYLHRKGWLERYAQAFEAHGDALYGASASYEGGKPHICTRAYAMKIETFWNYPHVIDSRHKGQKFETGEWCLTSWFRSKSLGCWQVTFDGEQEQQDWRTPEEIYRKGGQTNMLVWDKHTDYWRDADQAEKDRLTEMVNPHV